MTSAAGIKSSLKTLTLPDGRELTYELTRKRVKNINFRAGEDGIVRVSANSRATIKQIEGFLEERADFFFKAFETLKKRSRINETDLKTVRFLGREFAVRVIPNLRETAVFDESECRVFTKSSDKEYIAALIKLAMNERFKAICGELDEQARKTLKQKGFDPPPTVITIKEMKSRWGSCSYSKGKISINSRLAAYPRETILSVIFHEYAHYKYHDHSKRFYEFLLYVYPDYYRHNGILSD